MTLPELWPGQTGPRSCNRTWNVPFVFVLFHLFVEKVENSSLCTCWSKRKHFFGNEWGSLHKKHCVTVTNIRKAQAALCVLTDGALFFLFSLWLSSSKPPKMWFILRAALFLCEHIFGVSAATCLHYLCVPHYVCSLCVWYHVEPIVS